MNKHGWGLRIELVFILLFLICLLIVTIGVHRLGLSNDNADSPVDYNKYERENEKYDYYSLELRVANAAKRYYDTKYPSGTNDTVVVSVNTLKSSGFLSSIYDGRNKECKGYAKVLRNGNSVGYIRCSSYTTSGYSVDYE